MIKSNITKLSKLIDCNKIILTFPVIPTVNDTDDNIEQMIAFMKSCGLNKVEFHPYRKNSELKYKKLGLEYHPFMELSPIKLSHIKKSFFESGIIVQERKPIIERKKCGVLKEIRRRYCKENNIELKIEDCNYQGRCAGTCPKCEEELKIINEWRKSNA